MRSNIRSLCQKIQYNGRLYLLKNVHVVPQIFLATEKNVIFILEKIYIWQNRNYKKLAC